MFVSAIVAAGGAGERLAGRVPKPYVRIGGKPIIACSLIVLEKVKSIRQIVVVAEKTCVGRAQNLARRLCLRKVSAVIAGGATRSESVRRGLNAVAAQTELVVVHDAARPFITAGLVRRCIDAAAREGAAICAVPCVSTIKRVDERGLVGETLDRAALWQAQTPQVFAHELLRKAYAEMSGGVLNFFDDAALIETLPHSVKVVLGSALNIKITTPDDLRLARAIAGHGGSGGR